MTIFSLHPHSETVGSFAPYLAGLISSFHVYKSPDLELTALTKRSLNHILAQVSTRKDRHEKPKNPEYKNFLQIRVVSATLRHWHSLLIFRAKPHKKAPERLSTAVNKCVDIFSRQVTFFPLRRSFLSGAIFHSMNRLWQETLKHLEKDISPQHFSTWIKPIRLLQVEKDMVQLEVPNRFVHDWIRDHYLARIQESLSHIGAVAYRVHLLVAPRLKDNAGSGHKDVKTVLPTPDKSESTIRDSIKIGSLNSKYTFEEFVAGSSNQFAYAAAMAVANNPATTYNPLFIYGGVGLGKTHLINAIGNHILQKNHKTNICYCTSEKFMNELINSLRYAKMDEFRNKFRSMDVLLIDDVQFIAGKERTQEEFFHTFNALYEAHKQIIVTSDKFPKEIPGLEERLRSRFEWGLIADIQPPDVETKQAILKMKAEQNGIFLPEDVAQFLATSVSSNIRELEGYLVRIGAYASLTSAVITLAMTRGILKDILVEKNREITIEEIQKAVSSHYNLKISDIKSQKRLKALVLPRQIAMYLARQLTSSSYPEIGERFGGKDHSTIIHAIKKIEAKLEDDFQLRSTINAFKTALLN
ncbi:MAG: chromosomal replication initiator protein DnaA [Desulfuromonadales bacterium]